MKPIQKSWLYYFVIMASLAFVTTTQSACKVKEGCPVNEYTAKTDKKGNFKRGRAKSQLFPKKMNKKVKRRKH